MTPLDKRSGLRVERVNVRCGRTGPAGLVNWGQVSRREARSTFVSWYRLMETKKSRGESGIWIWGCYVASFYGRGGEVKRKEANNGFWNWK